MAQMVLPPALVPGAQKDSGPIKSGSDKEARPGDSRFESVSRAEQKRLDQKKVEHAGESRPTDKNQNADDSSASAGIGSEDSRNTADTDAKEKTDQIIDEVSENATPIATPTATPPATPLTFADLQALLAPAAGQVAGENSATGTFSTPGVLTQVIPANGPTNGILNGKSGSQEQSSAGLTLGLKLTEVLAGTVAPEGGRSADAANLLIPARFQTTLDAVSLQTTKLSAEATLPLKGYATSIDLPVGHSDWGDKMAGKLSWLTARGMSVAEIHLTPPDMGPMDVKVKLHHDQATITVHVANPVVRDQLELNSHRLRDMLAEQGVDLAQFDVSDSSQQQGGEQATGEGGSSGGQNTSDMTAGTDADEGNVNAGHLDLSWKGEVDIFA